MSSLREGTKKMKSFGLKKSSADLEQSGDFQRETTE